MLLKAKIRRFVGQMSTIFNKSTNSSEANKAKAPWKNAFDSPIKGNCSPLENTYFYLVLNRILA